MLPLALRAQIEMGKASFYGDEFEGRTTANGEIYKHNALTAAHKTLPFNTLVQVTNLANNKTVTVRINDRGPFSPGRVIDLSKSAAQAIDMITAGVVDARVEVINTLEGSGGGTGGTDGNAGSGLGEFYSMDVEAAQPSGYGVQIKSYQEMANLMRLSQELKTKYQQEVTIQVAQVQGKKVYRVILGQFANRAQAEALVERLKAEFTDCYVVQFSRL
ncbi:septal ring lytic transglycosylase RlpA family protein [Cytophagales bacterium LB-30]|uniref:Probable endolytic peptidoglycan transglycosylase RlpA n=1 Tax=Shiella aurantiaca TaxID=3058365 RepID=A0ABT8F7X2_9BACT|nr:septal ring lytic transglycosylase RlpA family protein [Shiella aurantiaca]MDN4166576.1 septal ring lytic transglycosylase RlpA family protein [Shiella aurantiaca]